jgi:DNA modification methylase
MASRKPAKKAVKKAASKSLSSLQIETWPLHEILPYQKNARRIPPDAIRKVSKSLKEFGWRQPMVVDKAGVLIVGHARRLAAVELGWVEGPVHVARDLTPEQIRAYRLMDNRSHEETDWDIDILKTELFELKDFDIDLSLTGFDDSELADFLNVPTAGLTDEDAVPAAPEQPVTVAGDLWVLRNHRVLCGDSTDNLSWERLSVGDGFVCFTSPPYNLGKSAALSGNKTSKSRGNAYSGYRDDQSSDKYRELITSSLDASLCFCEAAVFNVQPLAGSKREILQWLSDNAERFVDIVTWDKGHAAPAMAIGVLSSRFEWLCVFSKQTGASRSIPLSEWRGTLSNVYHAPPQSNNEFSEKNAATFPVHLPEFILSQLMNKSRGVVDCFCGTGTTLIAAEKLGRVGMGIEIDPAMCDVIITRWQNFTGQKATLDGDGRTFDEIKSHRFLTNLGAQDEIKEEVMMYAEGR